MNRGLLLSVLSCGLLVVAAGCGDDSGSGGSGGSGTTTSSVTGSTTTGNSTTKSTTTGMNTTSTGMMAANCTDYCAAIETNCSAVDQYPSVESCAEICAAFEPGAAPDTSMNTLECRVYHTGAAASMAEPHCYHAGPLGSGPNAEPGCGTDRCEAFCQIAIAVCDGNDVQWGTEADCLADCGMMPDDVDYTTAETNGDTLACRMYHLSVAAEAKNNGDAAGKATHCPHIALDSGPCGGA